jgi:hypothetical protein
MLKKDYYVLILILSLITEMIWTCIIIFILAVGYEGLKYYREYLLRSWRTTSYNISDAPNGRITKAVDNGGTAGRDPQLDMYAFDY